jgi:hypothetical protein
MGFFSEIIDTYKANEAGYVIKSIFEENSKLGLLSNVEVDELSLKLVQNVLDLQPEIFRGKKGVRPHKLVYALCALVMGLELFDKESSIFQAIILAFGRLQMEIINKRHNYSFSNLDELLINNSMKVTEELAKNAEA